VYIIGMVGEGVILCLYVDDILILGMSLDVSKETKEFLSNNFEMKDLGEADCWGPSSAEGPQKHN
jgi:hypothetical protein